MEAAEERLKQGTLLSQKTGVSQGKHLPLTWLHAESGRANAWALGGAWQLRWRGRLAWSGLECAARLCSPQDEQLGRVPEPLSPQISI